MPSADTWNPALYLRFADERTQPARDLAARVVLPDTAQPPRIIDLGCGPGNSTAVLRARWPAARELTGLDHSPEMIAAARAQFPQADWQLGDVATWRDPTGTGYDLVFSNAALHWLPDHAALFPHLLQQARPGGGVLAVQMPAQAYPALQTILLAVADSEPAWRERTQAARHAIRVASPGEYYDWLAPHAARLELWETRYHHVLDSAGAIVDWVRATGLRPYLDALESDADRARFEAALRAGAARAYPSQADGRVRFPFGRLFLLAYRR
ncbi:MAG: methyltransferase domain-containing protein [Verrucomicrobia bacterium]|nr:methyltransferase domain-containing protein [Verrucomicrobiota bacterium]